MKNLLIQENLMNSNINFQSEDCIQLMDVSTKNMITPNHNKKSTNQKQQCRSLYYKILLTHMKELDTTTFRGVNPTERWVKNQKRSA